MAKFSMKADRVTIQDGSRTVFDTAAKTFNAVPTGKLVLSGFTLTFPDFNSKGYRYLYGRGNYPTPQGQVEVCATLAQINPQEMALPDIDLGALPAGTDWLEIRINLTWTSPPPAMWRALGENVAWPTNIVPGQWMQLVGNSLVIEHVDNLARMFWIDIVAGRAVLRRKQSVGEGGFVTDQIESKARGLASFDNSDYEATDSQHCSFVNNYSYPSSYTGTIEITPCNRSIP